MPRMPRIPKKETAEKSLLRHHLKGAPRSKLQLNLFDQADSEILKLAKNEFLTTSIDSFDEEWTIGIFKNPRTLARVCVHGTLSDLVVTGATPLGFLFSPQWELSQDEIIKKLIFSTVIQELKKLSVPLLGGDEGRSASLSLTGVALGRASQKPVQRTGIKPGQILCTLGDFGIGPALGFQFLLNTRTDDRLENAYYPKAQIQAIPTLLNYAKGSMDSSDGLLSTLHTLSILNDVRFDLDLKAVSVHPLARQFCIEHEIPTLALWFGEVGDYQPIFTVNADDFKNVQKRLPTVKKIGVVAPKRQKKHTLTIKNRQIQADFSDYFNQPRVTQINYLEAFHTMLFWIESENLNDE